MTIDANVRTPEQLFKGSIRYVVPPYQRRYVWSKTEQWEPLWEDVQRLADDYMTATQEDATITNDKLRSHFLGAVVLQQEPTPTGSIEVRRVIDGQQRLTTLQILLDAAQEVFELNGIDRPARQLSNLILNDEDDIEDDEDERYKVWPSANDQSEFRYAMHNDSSGARPTRSLIIDAHDFFKCQVERWLDGRDDPPSFASGLRVVLARMLQVVVIDLDANAEPQIIFETLNARGTPLLQADLVRNYMILKAKAERLDEDEFNRNWLVPLSQPYWQEEVRFGRLVRARFEQFLYYWMMMRTAKDLRLDEVFREFQKLVEQYEGSVAEIAADIVKSAEVFRELNRPSPAGTFRQWSRYLHFRRALDINVDSPLMLWLFTKAVPTEQVDLALRAFESWYARRTFWGKRTEGLNRDLLGLVALLEDGGDLHLVGNRIVAWLKGQESERTVWISDRRFVEALTEYRSYGRLARARVAHLLERVEIGLRTNQAELQTLPGDLQIEHIMPKRWERHWPLTGETHPNYPDARDYRNYVVDFLGNLTLVTGKLNASVSNGPWETKRSALEHHSVLFLNKDVIQQGGPAWALADIHERTHRLAACAVEIWPGPDEF